MNTDYRPVASLRMTAEKYLAFAALGARQARAEPFELAGRAAFFLMILFVFSGVYHGVAAAGGNIGQSPDSVLWYIAMTEWVAFSAPMVMIQMEEDIRRGDVAYQIARPVSWLGARFAQSLGTLCVRAPVMLLIACAAAWIFAGPPERPGALVAGILFGFVAASVMTLFHVGIGVFAFWLGDIAPAYWIWQKFLFVAGGLLVPLGFYPDAFVFVAKLTPFPALLAGPASVATGAPVIGAGVLALALLFWAAAAALVARATFARAVRQLQVNGG